MNTHFSLSTMAGTQDAIITSSAKYLREDDGKTPKWVNEEAGICKFKRTCTRVIVYYEHADTVTKIDIDAFAIQQLAQQISEINKEEFEDIID